MYRIHQLYSTEPTNWAIISVHVKIFYRSYHLRDRLQWIWCSVCGHSGGKKDAEPKTKASGLVQIKADRGCGFYYFVTFVRVWRSNVTVWLKLLQCHEWPSSIVFLFMLCAFAVVFATVVSFVLRFCFSSPTNAAVGFNIHIVGKWFQLQRAFHILMTCAELKVGETRSDLFNTTSCLFIYHQHTPLHRLKEGSREGLWFAARFCWMERNFKFKTRNSRHLLICNKSA